MRTFLLGRKRTRTQILRRTVHTTR
jgi:hypothetical protein